MPSVRAKRPTLSLKVRGYEVTHWISPSQILPRCMEILQEVECEPEEDTLCGWTAFLPRILHLGFLSSTALQCKNRHIFENSTQKQPYWGLFLLSRVHTRSDVCAHRCHCCSCIACYNFGGLSVFPRWSSAHCRHWSHWWRISPGKQSDPQLWPALCTKHTHTRVSKHITYPYESYCHQSNMRVAEEELILCCCVFFPLTCQWNNEQQWEPSKVKWESRHRGNGPGDRSRPPMGATLWLWKSLPRFYASSALTSHHMSALQGDTLRSVSAHDKISPCRK